MQGLDGAKMTTTCVMRFTVRDDRNTNHDLPWVVVDNEKKTEMSRHKTRTLARGAALAFNNLDLYGGDKP